MATLVLTLPNASNQYTINTAECNTPVAYTVSHSLYRLSGFAIDIERKAIHRTTSNQDPS